MSIAALRFAPWRAKSQLPPAKYEPLTSSISRFLFHALSLSDSQLDVAWARSFVSTYVQDAARHVLHVPDIHEEAQASELETSIYNLTLQLAERLAKMSAGMDVSSLVDLAIVYGRKNATSVQTLFNNSLNSSPSLLEEFKIEVIPAFAATLEKPDRMSVYVLSQLLHCSPQVALLFAEDRKFSLELAKTYQVGLDKLAISRGGMIYDAKDKLESWQKDWLYTKTWILDAFHALVQALLQSAQSRHADLFFDTLFALLDFPSSSAISKEPFVSQTLLADYQYAFDLSGALDERFKYADDARVDLLAATLKDLAPAPRVPKPARALSVLLKDKTRRSVVTQTMIVSKGKGKAKEAEGPERDEALDLAVSQVLDIFPNETSQHIERCLRTFNGDSELLISALLEGTLPPDLADDNDNSTREIPRGEVFEFTKDRRNIWDNDAMDFSRLRIGKHRDDADELLQDRSFIEQMKADIIRRAEELSDDEAAREPRELAAPFYEDLDEDVESLVDKGVKVVGDGEESDESDDQGNADTPATIAPETILELAYIENPKVFDRDATTRRSNLRADLKSRTGWGDEQIEGWRIMLERNSNKDKILQKHEFSGNAPLVPDTNALEPGSGGSSRVEHSHRGRGRGGDGRKRGHSGRQGGGGGDNFRDRAWKDKNKARQANHNRKRGHDKKMARGGGSAPV